jgi:hypothetical protein
MQSRPKYGVKTQGLFSLDVQAEFSTFFHAGITFFHTGEKAGFGYSAVEGSLINLLRTLYGQG